MKKYKLLFMGMFILLIAAGCSQSIDKKIIGTWENASEDHICGSKIEDEKIVFDEDGMVVGITDFKYYKIDETDNEAYDYAVVNGDFNNTMRYKITIDEDERLWLVDEDDENGFDSSTSCHMEKVSD